MLTISETINYLKDEPKDIYISCTVICFYCKC